MDKISLGESSSLTEVQELSQDEIMRRNIEAVLDSHHKAVGPPGRHSRIADWVTKFSGSMVFFWVNLLWFAIWILHNLEIITLPGFEQFDPFPFSLLTLIVSLEAIFLSVFVLITQNNQAKISDRRAELDLQINLLAEQKIVKVLDMLDGVREQLNEMDNSFHLPKDPVVTAMKESPLPEQVLEALDKTEPAASKETKSENTGAARRQTPGAKR
jgi:uncharacterized membrane protein